MATLVTTSLGAPGQPAKYPTYYRTIVIDGLSIFYREAGPKDGPTILFLHGLPSYSHMFQPLFERLADRYTADDEIAALVLAFIRSKELLAGRGR